MNKLSQTTFVLTVLISAIIFFSCEKKGKQTGKGTVEEPKFKVYIDNEETIRLPVDTNTSVRTPLFSTKHKPKPFLYHFNPKTYCINVIKNINEPDRETESVCIDAKKLPSLAELGGMYIHTSDSIFLHSYSDPNIVVLINSEGETQTTFRLNENTEEFEVQPIPGMSYFSDQNKILSSAVPYLPPWDKQFYRKPIAMVYDIGTEKSTLKIGYPDAYKTNNYYPLIDPLFTQIDNSQFLVSFAKSHDVWLCSFTSGEELNLMLKKMQPVSMADKFKASAEFGNRLEIPEQSEYLSENPFYYCLWYDPYKKYFIRVLKEAYTEGLDSHTIQEDDYEFSFHFFDENMEYLGAYDLPKNIFNIRQAFITEEGLYLGRTNSNNPDLKEDEMIFSLISY